MKYDKIIFMVDVETLSTAPHTCPIVQLGIVAGTVEIGEVLRLHLNVLPMESGPGIIPCIRFDYDTVSWWMKRSAEARASVFNDQEIRFREAEAICKIKLFVDEVHKIVGHANASELPTWWGYGSTFDLVALRAMFARNSIDCPYEGRQERCYRTIRELFKQHIPPQENNPHIAVEDAKNQFEGLIAILKALS